MKAKELVDWFKDSPENEVLVTLFLVFDDSEMDCVVALEGELVLADKAHGDDAFMLSITIQMPSSKDNEAD